MAAGSAEQPTDNPVARHRSEYLQISTCVFCNHLNIPFVPPYPSTPRKRVIWSTSSIELEARVQFSVS